MKSNIVFLTSWLMSISLNAQTIVAGKIANPKSKVVQLAYWDGAEKIISTKINKDGSFVIKDSFTKPTSFVFAHGEEVTKMFLFPGDSIYLTLDTKMFDESIKYTGKGADVNNYLAKQYLHFENSIESPDFTEKYYRKIALSDAQTFTKYTDSLTDVQLNYLNKFKSTLPEPFYDYQFAQVVFGYANDKDNYPLLHYYVRGIEDSAVKVEPTYFNYYNELDIENENYLTSTNFVLYLDKLIDHKAKSNFKRDSVSYADKIVCARFLLKGNILQKAISEVILQSMDYGTPNEIKEMYALSQSEITDTAIQRTIEEKYKLISSLLPGNIAPPFSLYDKNGKLVSLSSLKGKVVYLDFWATWCGPCMMELPYAKTLQDSLKTKDIVFLYISVDEDEKEWKNTIAAKKMQGTHLLAKGIEHEVPVRYAVNGIPSYYIIGKDGKILNNNPARPSNPKVYTELLEALETK